MSDNNNEVNDGVDAESSARAEKIKAIRKAIDSGRKPEDADIPVSVRSHEAPPVKPVRLVRKNNEDSAGCPPDKPKKKRRKKKTFLQKLRSLFPEKNDGFLESMRKIVFLISIIAIIVCGYLVADYYIDLFRNNMRNDEFEKIHDTYKVQTTEAVQVNDDGTIPEKYYELLIPAQKMLDLNPEYAGFITLPTEDGDNVFALPVVRATDNGKYLNVSFTGEESRAGTLFMDWRNKFDEVENHHLAEKNSDNIVIYGHNMADDSMFGALKYYYRNNDYYDKHPIIFFESRYEVYTYKIFSTFILDAEDKTDTKFDCWNKLNFDDEEDFYNFVNEAKKRTFRTNNVDVRYGDELLTLSTCNTLLGDRGRLIVMARKVRPNEDIYEGIESQPNTNIKFPSLYYQTRTNEHYDPDAPFTPYGAESSE